MINNKYIKHDWRTAEKIPIRSGFGEGLVRVGGDERVVVLTADLSESCKVKPFEEKWPERFFEVGVAEQNMAGVAAGMALEGLIPFMASYAVFSPGRNWEQIRVSVALTNANVKIISSHGGIATGLNGPSHQALEDLALLRPLPNMTILTPCDATSCASAIEAAKNMLGPVYIRATRPDTPNFTKEMSYEIGRAQIFREGSDVTIVAIGIQVWEALSAAEKLYKEGIECEVINLGTVKPLDKETIIESAKKTKRVVSFEDHQIVGGVGSAVAELLSEYLPTRLLRMGVYDKWGESGDYKELYEKYELDDAAIIRRVRKFVVDS